MRPNKVKEYLKEILHLDKESVNNYTPMLWGGFGVGKSSIIFQVGEELGYEVRYIRLNTLSPVDVRGIPHIDPENPENFRFIPPEFKPVEYYEKTIEFKGKSENELNDQLKPYLIQDYLKAVLKAIKESKSIEKDTKKYYIEINQEEGYTYIKKKPVLLFFDEINTAPPANQVVAYEIALDRKMGGHFLPKNTRVIMAGNRSEDNGATYEMPDPLSNRLCHINLDVNIEDFTKYSSNKGILDSIIAFLNFRPDFLYYPNESGISPTPRTWEFVSEYLQKFPSSSEDLEKIGGFIGQEVAKQFIEYNKLKDNLPDLNDSLYKGKKLEKGGLNVKYFFTISLTLKLINDFKDYQNYKKMENKVKENFNTALENYINILLEFEEEIIAMNINLLKDDSKFLIYMTENRKLLQSIEKYLK